MHFFEKKTNSFQRVQVHQSVVSRCFVATRCLEETKKTKKNEKKRKTRKNRKNGTTKSRKILSIKLLL